jgi:hypothetical protein
MAFDFDVGAEAFELLGGMWIGYKMSIVKILDFSTPHSTS